MKKKHIGLFVVIYLLIYSTANADTLSDCPVSNMLIKCIDMTTPEDFQKITVRDFINDLSKLSKDVGGNLKATSCQRIGENQFQIDMNGPSPVSGGNINEIYGFQVNNDHAALIYIKTTRELNPREMDLFCHLIIRRIQNYLY